MGIYIYTLRKGLIKTADVDIARYSYAYKDGWGASETAAVKRKCAAADRAVEAIGHCKYFIVCTDVKSIGEKKEWILMQNTRKTLPADYNDSAKEDWCKPVGYVVRRGKKLVVEWGM